MCSLHASAPSFEEAPPPLSTLVDLYREYCIQEGCRINSAMIEYMKNNSVLQRITLVNNYVGPRGLRPVIRLLNRCQTITYVDFDSNGADNTTVEALFDVLRSHIGVTTLILRGNPISSTGGRRLLQLLELNPRITHIDVADTDIPEPLQERISALANQNFRRAEHDTPQLVEANHSIEKGEAQGTASLAERNVASLPRRPHRVWKATDVIAQRPRITLEAAAQFSGKDSNGTPAATLTLAAHEKQQLFDSANADAVPPLSAMGASSQLPSTLLRAIHQRFEERTRLYSEINESEMRNKVAEVRAEVVAVERNSQLRPVGNLRTVALPQPPCRRTAETDENPGVTPQVMDVSTEGHEREEDGTSASFISFQKQQVPDPMVEPDSMENQGNDDVIDNKINGNCVTEAATLGEKCTIEKPMPRPLASQHLEIMRLRDPKGGTLTTDAMVGISTDESFQTLFDCGCDAYAQKDLEAAYVAWNDALGIAVRKNNREWIAVLSSNLQRLSYELVVEEGVAYLDNGSLTKATESFQTALDIARKAYNAAWVAEMKKALKHVQSVLFTRCYEAAHELFRQAREDCEIRKCTGSEGDSDEETYYINPITKEKVRHSVYFLREWATVRLIREAVRMWAEAYRAAQRVSGVDAEPLKANVEKALDSVARFVFEQHVDVEEGETGLYASCPSWQRTSRYQHMERVMLTEVWFDILCCVDQGVSHVFMKVVTSLQLANLHMGTNQLEQAEKHLISAVDGSRKLQHKLLEATTLTYLATLYWLRSSHSLAERILLDAIRHWEDLLATSCREKDGVSVLGEISIPTFSVLLMQNACNSYLVCVLAATYRYREALEQLEHTLIHENSDLLTDKMLSAFCEHPSLDQIAAIASRAQTPFVYYFPARRLSYITEANAFDIEENLLIWLVLPCAEMRFVEINITKNFNITIEQAVRAARQGLLVEPIGQERSIGYRQGEDRTIDTATGIITTLHRKAWIEPLQILYEILMEPIYNYIMVLDPAAANKDHPETVLTIIPTGILWCVPFHALISKAEQFLVESIAIQFSFSATQVAFASLNAERVQQLDLHRDVVVVPLEISAGANGLSGMDSIDVERALEEGEAVMSVLKNAKWQRIRDTSDNKNPTEARMVSTEVMLRSAESLRSALSRSSILHITAPIHTTPASPSDTVAEHCRDLAPGGALCLPTDAGLVELVTARELQHSEIFAELVTLTNTNMTLAGVRSVRDDVIGVVRAFFSGGVPCVVAGQWCSPDMIPSLLFKKFYEVLADNKGNSCVAVHKYRKSGAIVPTVAVHKAMYLAMAIRRLLKEDEHLRYNPMAWAGYYCFGCGYF
ncbi:unnamed protein product [Phytomonas sp. EM1]|nr:unnamed protein product [Phytomonas sp. EM1]|eukprot:CCW63815.1 unnamed protein product [Phytomonas sp. isolate EM1]